MMRMGLLVAKQSKILFENKLYAVLCTALLAALPFASWLSVALVTLITLRKGAKAGFEVLLPALVVHSLTLMFLLPLESAAVNTGLAYLPCYFAAMALRVTAKWQIVASVLFLQASLVSICVHFFAPEFIQGQFAQLNDVLADYKEYPQVINAVGSSIGSAVLTELFFGIQMLSAAVTALLSLLFARSLQAKLFKPGGLKQELRQFRSGKMALTALSGLLGLACCRNVFAVNLLPLVLGYFLAAGLALVYFLLAGKKQSKMIALLGLMLFLKPLFVLFACTAMGVLDSVFNFRIYLPPKVREST